MVILNAGHATYDASSTFFNFKAKQTDSMTIQMIAIHTFIAGMMVMLEIKGHVQMDSSGITEF